MKHIFSITCVLLSIFSTCFAKFSLEDQYHSHIKNEYPGLSQYLDIPRAKTQISLKKLEALKTAGDICKYFKDLPLSNCHIAEIGAKDEVLCKILHETCGFASYTFLHQKSPSIDKSKTFDSIENVHFVEENILSKLDQYDVVIINEGFYTLDEKTQFDVFTHVIDKSLSGYMKFSSLKSSIPMEDVVARLIHLQRKGFVERDHPLEYPEHMIITWGTYQAKEDVPLEPLPEWQPGGSAITYSLSKERLGDNLIAHFQARWLAYKYQLPFFRVPFEFSEQFAFAKTTQLVNRKKFKHVKQVKTENAINKRLKGTLFIVSYYSKLDPIYDDDNLCKIAEPPLSWVNKAYKVDMALNLQPEDGISPSYVPNKERLSLGVHVRKGGGYDNARTNHIFPLKLPPDHFYLDQIRSVAHIFKGKPIDVYILTDDKNPQAIVEEYENTLQNPDLQFIYRKEDNGPANNILEDFHSIPQFDCLIRPDSHFSQMASQMKNYLIHIYPIGCKMDKDGITINDVVMTFDGDIYR